MGQDKATGVCKLGKERRWEGGGSESEGGGMRGGEKVGERERAGARGEREGGREGE